MRNAQHRSSLFLVELIIDLALFAICAAVCVALLVHARGMSRESSVLTQAVYAAQDMAERWKSGVETTWCTPSEYGITGHIEEHGNTADIVITDFDSGEVVYALEGVTRLE